MPPKTKTPEPPLGELAPSLRHAERHTADYDQPRPDIIETPGLAELEVLACAIARWQGDPTNPKKLSTAQTALGRAETAFAEYDTVLTTWAAGPSGAPR